MRLDLDNDIYEPPRGDLVADLYTDQHGVRVVVGPKWTSWITGNVGGQFALTELGQDEEDAQAMITQVCRRFGYRGHIKFRENF